MYYENKLETLKDIFGAKEASLKGGFLTMDGTVYPVIDDVVILCGPESRTEFVNSRLGTRGAAGNDPAPAMARDIQATFGSEWKDYSAILPEHEKEFRQYFDLVPEGYLKDKRCCDLGCGMGRWSRFLAAGAKEIILVDFSDAIFVARENLRGNNNCLFFMGDLARLPFRQDFADFIFSLGVLHHLPVPCLEQVRKLKKAAPELLIFLYYALDNRPRYFRFILKAVTAARGVLWRIRSRLFRKLFSALGAYLLYIPLVALGKALKPFGLAGKVPLYDFYRDKTAKRIEQDVYDRFFTRIEQRVTREQILALKDSFASVYISENLPYWHFLCRR